MSNLKRGDLAVAYIRVDKKTSPFANQAAEIEDFCDRRGVTLVATFFEVGRGNHADRPVIQDLIRFLQAKRAYYVIVGTWERFGLGTYAEIGEMIQATDAEVLSVYAEEKAPKYHADKPGALDMDYYLQQGLDRAISGYSLEELTARWHTARRKYGDPLTDTAPTFRVEERKTPPQVGETLYSPEQHLKYTVTEAFDGTHILLGCTLDGPHYVIQWEDGRDQRVSLCQMYYDDYVYPGYFIVA